MGARSAHRTPLGRDADPHLAGTRAPDPGQCEDHPAGVLRPGLTGPHENAQAEAEAVEAFEKDAPGDSIQVDVKVVNVKRERVFPSNHDGPNRMGKSSVTAASTARSSGAVTRPWPAEGRARRERRKWHVLAGPILTNQYTRQDAGFVSVSSIPFALHHSRRARSVDSASNACHFSRHPSASSSALKRA